MSYLGVFALWLQEKELAGRPDGTRVAEELTSVAARTAEGADPGEGDRILDLGSGTGAIALAAADGGSRVVAVDVDAPALARGRELALSIEAPIRHVVADARSLPMPDATFDAAVHRSVLIYMTRRELAVREEYRVLRPGGRVSCSESLGTDLDLETEDLGIERVWRGGLRDILIASPDAFTLSAPALEFLYVGNGFEDVSTAAVRHAVTLESPDAVARAFAVAPPAALSARERWQRSGIPAGLIDEFLARLAAEADRGRPATLIALEGYLTARKPPA